MSKERLLALISSTDLFSQEEHRQRRRITTEEKANVVAAVWGTECTGIQFLAALDVLPRTILKSRINSSFFLEIILVQFILNFKLSSTEQLARQGIE